MFRFSRNTFSWHLFETMLPSQLKLRYINGVATLSTTPAVGCDILIDTTLVERALPYTWQCERLLWLDCITMVSYLNVTSLTATMCLW